MDCGHGGGVDFPLRFHRRRRAACTDITMRNRAPDASVFPRAAKDVPQSARESLSQLSLQYFALLRPIRPRTVIRVLSSSSVDRWTGLEEAQRLGAVADQ